MTKEQEDIIVSEMKDGNYEIAEALLRLFAEGDRNIHIINTTKIAHLKAALDQVKTRS